MTTVGESVANIRDTGRMQSYLCLWWADPRFYRFYCGIAGWNGFSCVKRMWHVALRDQNRKSGSSAMFSAHCTSSR